MTSVSCDQITAIEWILPTKDLAISLEFYTQKLGFRIDAIFPADTPRVAQISLNGYRIKLEQSSDQPPGRISLLLDGLDHELVCNDLVSPDGTIVELAFADPVLQLPILRV